jgi:polar amino acid transport system permease protein
MIASAALSLLHAANSATPGYDWDWGVVFSGTTWQILGIGVRTTLLVSLVSLVIGSLLGFGTAIARLARVPVLRQVCYLYMDLFRTTPALVQLIWIFYVLPILLHITIRPEIAGIIALSLNSGAFLSEIFRGGLASIDRGQRDASFVLGLSTRQSYTSVLIPQTVRRIMPAIANQFISLLKESSLLSVIAVPDLTYQFQVQVADTFRPLELYTALAVAYFLITYPMSLGVSYLERRFPIL